MYNYNLQNYCFKLNYKAYKYRFVYNFDFKDKVYIIDSFSF